MLGLKKELEFWRFLSHFWGILTALFFLVNFLKILDLSQAIKTVAVIYIGILSLFTTTKEFARWKNKKFLSNHNGELFIFIWTILILIFIFFNVSDPIKYQIPGEFTATYLSILGIFAISRQSRNFKNHNINN
ncbi:hypothetical protein H6761_03160 [Candidatus Nomurabacteria bacterium]|nr:hypothetical protein [Candidatus Nomurabacteria bacterium]